MVSKETTLHILSLIKMSVCGDERDAKVLTNMYEGVMKNFTSG